MTALRSTQQAVETLSDAVPNLRSSQEVVEVASNAVPKLRLSQQVIEVISSVRTRSTGGVIVIMMG